MPEQKKIMVGIPAYDSKVFGLGMISLFHNKEALEKMGYYVNFYYELKCVYMDLVRNKIVNAFLKGDYTDLIFVDSDLAFDGNAMVKLMEHDVPVVGGAYPFREAEQEGFPVSVKLNDDNTTVTDAETGLIECNHIPTGLMRIQRWVIDDLAKKLPHMVDRDGILQLFSTGQTVMYEQCISRLLQALSHKCSVDINNPFEGLDNGYYGEDVFFCKMCNALGMKVYCDPSINFIHIGNLLKKGNYSDFLLKNGESK